MSTNASADVRISTFQAAPEMNPNTFESMTLVPSVTCFITSLEHGTPFRISVHSWQKPVASSILRAYKTPEEKTAFEARVYVDGVLQRFAHSVQTIVHRLADRSSYSQRLFDQENAWPEVIGRLDNPQSISVLMTN